MQLKGTYVLQASANTIWDKLMDSDTLAEITPGISELQKVEEDKYLAIANIKMGPVDGSFQGNLEIAEKNEPNSFILKIKQNSKIGNAAADVTINIKELSAEQTEVSFNGKVKLSGLLARMGQRVLSGVANALSKQFFKALEKNIEDSKTA